MRKLKLAIIGLLAFYSECSLYGSNVYQTLVTNWDPITRQVEAMKPDARRNTLIVTDIDETLYFDRCAKAPSLQWELFNWLRDNTCGLIGCTQRAGKEWVEETQKHLSRDKFYFTSFELPTDSALRNLYVNGCIFGSVDPKLLQLAHFVRDLQKKGIVIHNLIFVDDKEENFRNAEQIFKDLELNVWLYEFRGKATNGRSHLIVDQTEFEGIPLTEAFNRCYPDGVKFTAKDPKREVPAPAYPPADTRDLPYHPSQAWQEAYTSKHLLLAHRCTSGGQYRIKNLFVDIQGHQPNEIVGSVFLENMIFLLTARSMISTSLTDTMDSTTLKGVIDSLGFGVLLKSPIECIYTAKPNDACVPMENDSTTQEQYMGNFITNAVPPKDIFLKKLSEICKNSGIKGPWVENPKIQEYLSKRGFSQTQIEAYVTYFRGEGFSSQGIYEYFKKPYPQEDIEDAAREKRFRKCCHNAFDTPDEIIEQLKIVPYNEVTVVPRCKNPANEISIVGLFYEPSNFQWKLEEAGQFKFNPETIVSELQAIANRMGVPLYNLDELKLHPRMLDIPHFSKGKAR
ncbi:MAG: hypothetical protein A2007_05335 [Verrucomicrobia bacterium GWC2_42_7]|nr:MAG: hypothetical protein A2007_05335 [Verrucomicrobia bacterium GWC2_42_7]